MRRLRPRVLMAACASERNTRAKAASIRSILPPAAFPAGPYFLRTSATVARKLAFAGNGLSWECHDYARENPAPLCARGVPQSRQISPRSQPDPLWSLVLGASNLSRSQEPSIRRSGASRRVTSVSLAGCVFAYPAVDRLEEASMNTQHTLPRSPSRPTIAPACYSLR
jgi:hypothetical protein